MTSLATVEPVRLEWVGPLAFARKHPGPPGVDVDFGDRWGPRGDQRVSWRHDLYADVGFLYAYDSLWNEFAVLATGVTKEVVHDAYRLAVRDPRVVTVEAFAGLTRRLRPSPAPRVEPVGLEPEL